MRFPDRIKTVGQGLKKSPFPGLELRAGSYYECGPWLLAFENRRKVEPKEILSCLILCLLIVFTQQLEILVTTLCPVVWDK